MCIRDSYKVYKEDTETGTNSYIRRLTDEERVKEIANMLSGYNSIDETVSIPNKEVSKEYVNAISTMNWHGVPDLPMYA